MKSNALGFLSKRFMAGRRDSLGNSDLARRAIRGAVLSIALSLVPLITVIEVADGMIAGISARYIELGSSHAQIHSPVNDNDWFGIKETLNASAVVRGAWLESQSIGIAFSDGKKSAALIRGVEQGFLDDPGTVRYLEMLEGSTKLEGINDAMIGSAIAENLGLKPGDTITIATLRKSSMGQILPRLSVFNIVAIVSAGYRELDSEWIFIRQDAVARYIARDSIQTMLSIKTSINPYKLAEIEAALSPLIDRNFRLYTWRDLQFNLYESLENTKKILILIMALTVAVASVNIASALFTLVDERSREIAILKSMGAGKKGILAVFSLGGAFLGAIGAILGIAGGMLTSLRINEIIRGMEWLDWKIRSILHFLGGNGIAERGKFLDPEYYLERIPIEIGYKEIAAVAIATILLSFLSAILPARKAARLDPMTIFRYRG